MPKLTIKKLRPAWYRSTLRSVHHQTYLHSLMVFINVTSTALLISIASER